MVAMAGTTIEATKFDGMPAWRLTSASGATALVAERGATLISWEPRPGINVIDGYESVAEMEDGRDARSRLWPLGQAVSPVRPMCMMAKPTR